MAAGIFHLIIFICLLFLMPKSIKGIKKRLNILKKIKNGEIKTAIFYIIKKGRSIRHYDDSLNGYSKRIRNFNYYIDTIDYLEKKQTFSLLLETYDSVLEKDYVSIKYVDGYEYALMAERTTH